MCWHFDGVAGMQTLETVYADLASGDEKDDAFK
jgi:hypothetical protein